MNEIDTILQELVLKSCFSVIHGGLFMGIQKCIFKVLITQTNVSTVSAAFITDNIACRHRVRLTKRKY